MPQVERTGDVGRRHDDAVRLMLASHCISAAAPKRVRLRPLLMDSRLDCWRLIRLFEHRSLAEWLRGCARSYAPVSLTVNKLARQWGARGPPDKQKRRARGRP